MDFISNVFLGVDEGVFKEFMFGREVYVVVEVVRLFNCDELVMEFVNFGVYDKIFKI